MRLVERPEEHLGGAERRVPAAGAEIEQRQLDAAPPHETDDAEPGGQVDDLPVELVPASQVAEEVGHERGLVPSRPNRLGRADRRGDGRRLLEIGEAADVATRHACGADVVERVGLELPQVELLGEREAFTADLDGLLRAAREHEEPRGLRVDLRLRGRCRPVGDERAGATEPREGRVVAAGEPVALREQHLRLSRALEVPLGDHSLQGPRHQRLLAALTDTEVGPRVAQDEGGPPAVLFRRELERA